MRHPYRDRSLDDSACQRANAEGKELKIMLALLSALAVVRCVVAAAYDEPSLGEPLFAAVIAVAFATTALGVRYE